jgi:hypothetical protein
MQTVEGYADEVDADDGYLKIKWIHKRGN